MDRRSKVLIASLSFKYPIYCSCSASSKSSLYQSTLAQALSLPRIHCKFTPCFVVYSNTGTTRSTAGPGGSDPRTPGASDRLPRVPTMA